MDVTVRERDGVTVLDLEGRLVIGSGDLDLRNAVGAAIDRGVVKLLISMRGVSTIDSSGVGELASAHARATRRVARVKLANVPVYDNEDEALQSF